jgi:hypothetical protein
MFSCIRGLDTVRQEVTCSFYFSPLISLLLYCIRNTALRHLPASASCGNALQRHRSFLAGLKRISRSEILPDANPSSHLFLMVYPTTADGKELSGKPVTRQ